MTRRILVIDADEIILNLYIILLEEEGHEVHSSTIFYEDVHEIEQLAPSLIILDITQGHQAQGLALLGKIRAYPSTQAIPLIVSTTVLREVQEQEASLLQEGIPIIYRPFDIDEVLEIVRAKLSCAC